MIFNEANRLKVVVLVNTNKNFASITASRMYLRNEKSTSSQLSIPITSQEKGQLQCIVTMKKSVTIFEKEIYAYLVRMYCFHLPQASVPFCSDRFGAYSMVTLAYKFD